MNLNILIATPAYGGMIHIDYLNSILDFHKAKLPISVMCIGNESLITRARNTSISYFHHLKQFTHLLFFDADIGLTSDGLISLLRAEKDFIGAKVYLKGKDALNRPVDNVWGSKHVEGNLYEVDKVGTAVMLMSRKLTDALIKDADPYQPSNLTRGQKADFTMYDVFKVGVVDNEYISEDYWVCNKARELGFKVYVDMSINTIHNGNYRFGE